MLTGLKDLITAIGALTLLAYSTGQQKWYWAQFAILHREALIESRKNWECPSIFKQTACQKLDTR
ncbi:MAG: hypothetical protein ACXWRE_01350 [Pseudobdellovibrionaceae bacterium]